MAPRRRHPTEHSPFNLGFGNGKQAVQISQFGIVETCDLSPQQSDALAHFFQLVALRFRLHRRPNSKVQITKC
jgi:hypothetical protein